jgi:hypothetical protein
MNGSATIGSLCVLALIIASDAANRGILGEKTWEAYLRLKEKVGQCIDDEESLLEQLGLSMTKRTRVSSAIEHKPPEFRTKIKTLASALIEALKADVLRGSLGISLRRLETIQADLQEIG